MATSFNWPRSWPLVAVPFDCLPAVKPSWACAKTGITFGSSTSRVCCKACSYALLVVAVDYALPGLEPRSPAFESSLDPQDFLRVPRDVCLRKQPATDLRKIQVPHPKWLFKSACRANLRPVYQTNRRGSEKAS
jgi:hypothetical protein